MRHALKFAVIALVLSAATAMSALRAEDTVKLPEWVPAFPDAKPTVIENKTDTKEFEQTVTLSFTTPKTPVEVRAFYEAGFEKSGFKKDAIKGETINDDGKKQENSKADDGKRQWFISALQDKDAKETIVSLVYRTKK